MRYSTSFDILNSRFNQIDPEIPIKEMGLIIKSIAFQSQQNYFEQKSPKNTPSGRVKLFDIPDQQIDINNNFYYSIFLKDGDQKKKHKHVILMLHGLNERKWSKYLPWAASIVEKSGIPVVLFPISFHMNRSPQEWSNPRLLMPMVKEKINTGVVDETTTIANFTLSKRLEEAPERFFLSGYQSINDVFNLIEGWKNNEEQLIHPEVRVDFFSYSIGAFLTQTLMIANPQSILNDSRFFFFCGGSLFSDMNAESKFIMNKSSFERIHHYYTREFETDKVQKGKYADLLNWDSFGRAFRAMITPEMFKHFRSTAFGQFQNQLKAVGLKKDTVIPSPAILNMLSDTTQNPGLCYEEMDFEYPYSHENPFDHKLTRFKGLIDNSFDMLMEKACGFLAV